MSTLWEVILEILGHFFSRIFADLLTFRRLLKIAAVLLLLFAIAVAASYWLA